MPKPARAPDPVALDFGRYVKRLRNERGQTQEQLAEFADLSADTIRRLEHGSFSPSLDTLSKLARGLRIDLTTLFGTFEHGDRARASEVVALSRSMDAAELTAALRLLVFLVSLLSALATDRAAGESGGAGE